MPDNDEKIKESNDDKKKEESTDNEEKKDDNKSKKDTEKSEILSNQFWTSDFFLKIKLLLYIVVNFLFSKVNWFDYYMNFIPL